MPYIYNMYMYIHQYILVHVYLLQMYLMSTLGHYGVEWGEVSFWHVHVVYIHVLVNNTHYIHLVVYV